MNKLHGLLVRYFTTHRAVVIIRERMLNKLQLSTSCSTSDVSTSSSSSDDEVKIKKKQDAKKKSEDALSKLNNLLKTMIDEDVSSNAKLDLAKPTDKRKRKIKEEPVAAETPEAKIVNAAKVVAEAIGGDVKKTQSELLMKLLDVNSEKKSVDAITLNEIVKEMKVEKEPSFPNEINKAEQVKQALQHSRTPFKGARFQRDQRAPILKKIDLFGSEPLGIFTKDETKATNIVENSTWNKLYERDLKLAITHPPTNYFQQMILWTKQGKVWKFPIDNEYGLNKEKKVYFADHIFLEKHLEPWCPNRGPIRHFMELVCVGLSKNPYLTVEAKKGHIEWFRDYFYGKQQLLQEVGLVLGPETEDTKTSVKQIEQ